MRQTPDGTRTPGRPSLRHRTQAWLKKMIIAATDRFRGKDTLDIGLQALNEQLGLQGSTTGTALEDRDPATIALPAADVSQAIVYAPDMDGQTDPGEVVWVPVQLDPASQLRERAVVVLGRRDHTLLCALISTHESHAGDPNWVFIGVGAWDREGRASWARVDRVLLVPESGIRRSGAMMPRRRFDRIAHKLRSDYQWS